MTIAIETHNISKTFEDNHYALNNLSFHAKKGEAIGVVGINGSGKSTLMNLIAHKLKPTSGTVTVSGKVSIASFPSTLHPTLTTKEHIQLHCAKLDLSKEEATQLEQNILAFINTDFLTDQPVRLYPAGAKMKLQLGLLLFSNADIFIIDEALSVGDKAFSKQCFEKLTALKQEGKTILFVSHSNAQIEELCDKTLWLEKGTIKKFGETESVLSQWEEYVEELIKN